MPGVHQREAAAMHHEISDIQHDSDRTGTSPECRDVK
jgi:hypothetical protein